MDGKELYGLVGFPLGHSFSRAYFTDKFRKENIDAEYVNFELPDIDGIKEIVASTPLLRGFNVTIPYKSGIIPYLTRLSEEAAEIGAVNVVRVERDGSLSGFNSDVYGFTESLRPLIDATHRRALVLGSGGASKAVCHGLKMLGIEPTVVSRTPVPGALTYASLTPETVGNHTVIVNTTPLGMYPRVDTCPDIPYDALTPRHVCFDLVYNPTETLFMRKSAEAGATVKNGLEMLHLQAERSFELWQSDHEHRDGRQNHQ